MPSSPTKPRARLRFADRFDLLRQLGRGAHARVYAAHDRDLNRLVALKIFALRSKDVQLQAEARSRFGREASVAARLRHADIVQVLEAGSHDGQDWLAMELVPGTSLERYTHPEKLLPEPALLRVGQRIALALDHAHGQGVVHRDLKPANVLVHWPSDTLKIADFGLARTEDAAATRTGLLLGTPQYMAPELLAGERPDARSDFYALGVVLFELVSGQLPFQGSNMGELLRRVAREPAPDLRSIKPHCPDELAHLLAELLATRPDQRLADGARVAGRLRSLRLAWPGGAISH
jgi:serine/threonine-protein kinase